MLNGIVGVIRRWNRARLERRHLAKANGQLATGFFGRLVQRLREKNHDRLARRRAARQLLSALAANDTALLEGLVFLLRSARQAEQARAAADEALQKRLSSLEERLGEGHQLGAARQLLSALAANDTALLEGHVYLLKSARQAEQARAAADAVLQKRLSSLEERLGEGLQLVTARLQMVEARLPAAARTNEALPDAGRLVGRQAAPTTKGNGELPRISAGGEEGAAKRAELASTSPETTKGGTLPRL